MDNLRGKRLLFLGGIRALCEAVEYAKSMGIYTIVTDYLPDSPAKKVADKGCMVSTTDIDALVQLCEEEKVDGVFTAFIDSMLPYARMLCDRLNMPFYASEEQIRLSLDKCFFKEVCRKYDVPVPREYYYNSETNSFNDEVNFPVIVKPVDSSGGRGIRICNDIDTLKLAYDEALNISPGKKVLVEEFVSGIEVTATYTMKDGDISLSCFKDKLVSLDHPNITSQCDVLICPSADIDMYIERIHPHVVNMLKAMKATDGTVFFQGISNGNNVVFFECGYRPNGGADYRHIDSENGINFLKMMIAHSLTGCMEGAELVQDNPRFEHYCLNLNIYAHAGTIGHMSGIDAVRKISNVTTAEYMHDIGDVIKDTNTLSQRVCRAVIRDKSIKNVKETIRQIQQLVKVTDVNGNNMLYLPFDVERLEKRFGGM